MSYLNEAFEISQIFLGVITGVYCFSNIGLINSSIHGNLGFYFRQEIRENINICVMGCYCYLMILHTTNIYGFLMSCHTKAEAYCKYYFLSFVGMFHLLMTMFFGVLIYGYHKELCFLFGNFWFLTTCHLKNTLFSKTLNKNKDT